MGPAYRHRFPAAIFATACSTGGNALIFYVRRHLPKLLVRFTFAVSELPVRRMPYFAIQKI
jgi:hypothetical protein